MSPVSRIVGALTRQGQDSISRAAVILLQIAAIFAAEVVFIGGVLLIAGAPQ